MSSAVEQRFKIGETEDGLFVATLYDVRLNHGRSWNDAITAGGRDTPPQSDIWKVGGLYPPPTRQDVEIVPFVSLVGFKRNWESPEGAVLYAKYGLPNISPRLAFALGEEENFPNLNNDLDMGYLGVLSMETRSFVGDVRVPYLWFDDDERGAILVNFGFSWHDYSLVGLLGEVPLVS